MTRLKCKLPPVNSFNRLGEPDGISAISRNGLVDSRDSFVKTDGDGKRTNLRFKSPAVQSIIRKWRSDCISLSSRLASPAIKSVARAFGVKFGLPAIESQGDSERFGVYRKGKHLFDVDAGGDKNSAIERVEFTERALALTLSDKLGVSIPQKYCAHVTISPDHLEVLNRLGVSVDRERGMIFGPAGEQFYFARPSGGATAAERVEIEASSDSLIKITMTLEDGKKSSALFPLKAGAEGTDKERPSEKAGLFDAPMANPFLSDDECEEMPDSTIREDGEKGKKRIIKGPGISITVYD
jgi:hypothetical protein